MTASSSRVTGSCQRKSPPSPLKIPLATAASQALLAQAAGVPSCSASRAGSADATSCRGMGTTLVAALVRPEDAAVVNIGDSRCYWLADGQLQQVTRDHSLVQSMVDRGLITEDEARSHPRKNVIMRAVGLERTIRSDIFRLDIRPGDALLLCSDGLSNLVDAGEMESLLLASSDDDAVCRELLRMALDRGAPDNVTLALVRR